MFKKILKYFQLKKTNKIKEEPKSTKISSITFELNSKGGINILCEWPEFTSQNSEIIKDIAQSYATMLYSLNNGMLETDIFNTMKNCDKSNVFNALFYENVLIEAMLIEKQQQFRFMKHEPLIHPTQVFKEN